MDESSKEALRGALPGLKQILDIEVQHQKAWQAAGFPLDSELHLPHAIITPPDAKRIVDLRAEIEWIEQTIKS